MIPGNGSSSGTNCNNFDGGTRSGEEHPVVNVFEKGSNPALDTRMDRF